MKTKLYGSKYFILILVVVNILFLVNCEKQEEYLEEEKSDSFIELKEKIILEQERVGETTNSKILPDLTGYYRCNDDGHYYIRQIGSKIYWFGEHPSGYWANVFIGSINGNQITGTFKDVPKGSIQGSGGLTISVLYNGFILSKTSGNNFGGSVWVRTSRPTNLPGTRPAGFGVRNDIDNLTGRWYADDGGYYYVRQINNSIIWFGERNFSSGNPSWSNIAFGSRFGNTLWLDWVDVPKGNAGSNGILRIYVENSNYMWSGNATGGFGGAHWRR